MTQKPFAVNITIRSCVALAVFLCVSVFVGIHPRTAYGQAEQGTITGSVKDPSGAMVSGAKITATNVATNVVSTTVSDARGYYTIPYLNPGMYNVSAEAQGFSVSTVSNANITVNLSTAINFTLQIGAIAQQITVQANAIQLETENSELGGTATREQILNLPQNGRNPYNLIALDPGVLPVYSNSGIQVTANGGEANTTNILLDGATQVNASTGDPAFTPPLESVGELKYITNNYSAEYGMSGSGVLTMSSQSGSNQFHGSAYEYLKNTDFNANGWYNDHVGNKRTPTHGNQFGFSVGGPVTVPKVYDGRNKTFFFTNLEWDPSVNPDNLTATVPTTAMLGGDFSHLVDQSGNPIIIYDPATTALVPGTTNTYTRTAFPGNVIPPYRITNPIVKQLLTYYPPATPKAGIEGIYNNFLFTPSRTTSQDTFLARVDQSFGSKHKAFISIGRHSSLASTPDVNLAFPQSGTNGDPGGAASTAWTGTVSDTFTITPRLLIEFRGNFTHWFFGTILNSQGFDISSLGFPASFVAQTEAKVFPQISITDMTGLGIQNSSIDSDTEGSNQGQAHLTWVKAQHTINAGFDYRFVIFNEYRPLNGAGYFTFSRNYTQGPNPTAASTDAGFGLASFLLGAPDGGYITHDAPATASQKDVDWYVNDDYKLTSRLTLNLGLRWDVLTGFTDRHNKLTWFNPTVPDPVTNHPGIVEFAGVGGNPRAENDTVWTNFAPRLGFAYQLGTKTAIRGGYGFFYVTNSDGNVAGTGFQVETSVYTGPPVAAPNTPPTGASLSNPFAGGYLPYPAPAGALVGQSVGAPFRPGTLPTHQDWNLSVQRALSTRTVLTVAYAGSRGEHIWYNLNKNSDPISDLSLGPQLTQQVPNPYYGLGLLGTLGAPTVAYDQLLKPFPQYTGLSWYHDAVGDSYYEAGTVQLRHQDSHGLVVQGSYTFSKSIDDVPERYAGRTSVVNPEDLGFSRSISEYTRPNWLVVNYIYPLPFGRGHEFLGKGPASYILGNWQISGITTYGSGEPIVISGPNNAVVPGITSLADRLHDPHLKGGLQNPEAWFDITAYGPAALYTTGTGHRVEPDLRGPAEGNWDMGLYRAQNFREGVKLELRVEAYNVLNNRNLNVPNGSITSGTFGQITGNGQARALQIGARLGF
jgi:hypothetical protein